MLHLLKHFASETLEMSSVQPSLFVRDATMIVDVLLAPARIWAEL